MAEYLGIPHVAYVEKVLEVKEKSVVVRASMDKTIETFEVALPCLLTIDKGHVTPRLPSYKRGKEFKDVVIPMITFNDVIDQDETHYGLKGSPTQVERMFPPERNTDKVVLTGSLSEQVDKLTEILKNKKYI